MEDAAMTWSSGRTRSTNVPRTANLILPLALLVLLGRVLEVWAQEPTATGRISGTVVDEQGVALAGAEVSLVGSFTAAQAQANGRYSFPAVRSGTYRLQARLVGFRPQLASLTVKAGQ